MIELQARGPFIFRDTVFAHGWVRLAPYGWEEERRELTRVERLLSGRVVRLRYSAPEPERLQDRLRVVVEGCPALSEAERAAVVARSRWSFGLDEELGEFHARCAAEADTVDLDTSFSVTPLATSPVAPATPTGRPRAG